MKPSATINYSPSTGTARVVVMKSNGETFVPFSCMNKGTDLVSLYTAMYAASMPIFVVIG